MRFFSLILRELKLRGSSSTGRLIVFFALLQVFWSDSASLADEVTLNLPGEGYRGLWYNNQKLDSIYRYKYSGGLGTYTAKHKPLAVYCPEVGKTFFCFGGVRDNYHLNERLKEDRLSREAPEEGILHMVAAYDHKTGMVSRPTILLDKKTYDAHDNPVMSVDKDGRIWIFSTAHGLQRPAYVHRSVEPWDISKFELVQPYRLDVGEKAEIDNYSYMQAWALDSGGFALFFTLYSESSERKTYYCFSPDGELWDNWTHLAAIEKGHYQISGVHGNRAASVLNYHPLPVGLNARTNLYYIQTENNGKSWSNVMGEKIQLPLVDPENSALVHDYESEGLLVYLKDIVFDKSGNPLILFITSRGFESGPDNDPRTWRLARWTGRKWQIDEITRSDSNYDMGSLYWESEDDIRIVAPTETGGQPYNPGGEIAMWRSSDGGETWSMLSQVTATSDYNHTYVRRPVNAHPDFYAFWADGHARMPSPSRLYFSNKQGDLFQLPEIVNQDWVAPIRLID